MEVINKDTPLAFQGDIALFFTEGFAKDYTIEAVKDWDGVIPAGFTLVTQTLDGAGREDYGYHPEKGLVLAQGESRAHYHAFRDTENTRMYMANDNKSALVLLKTPATLFHEEHKAIEFDAGLYRLFFQQEYTYEEEYRRLAD